VEGRRGDGSGEEGRDDAGDAAYQQGDDDTQAERRDEGAA
jgi:hypothetical protein